MNQFDAEKHENEEKTGNMSSDPVNRQYAETGADGQTDAEYKHTSEQSPEGDRGYSFIGNGSPDGRGYTTPGGSHGYVYSPNPSPGGDGVGRKAIIAMGIVGTAILLMGACFFGAWAVARSEEENSDGEGEDTVYTYEVPGTTDGLFIVDGTDATEEKENQENIQEESSDLSSSQGSSAAERVDLGDGVPADATIEKEAPEREDDDGDGKADIAYDKAGNVITSAGEECMSAATVVAKVAASVVEISTETLVQSGRVGQYITSGAGSGVIIAKEGFIVTNHHVIDGADTVTVRLNDGTQYAATLVGTDEATDIAVLWIDAGQRELTVATLGSSYDLVAGEDILAIGNPLGSLGGTVTEGIISATERQISIDGNDMSLLQISAPINPGNSGGGLFNMAGELIGVVNAKMSSEEIEGLGFAIPVDVAYEVICELIEYRYVRGRPTTGLTLVDVSNVQTAIYYFNSRYTGVYVYEYTGTADLKYGDLILSVNGTELSTSEDVSGAIAGCAVGDTVELVIYRSGKQMTVELELVEYIPDYMTQEDEALAPVA